MSYTLLVGSKKGFPLSTVSGWGEVLDWVDELEADGIDELLHLAEYGYATEPRKLESAIQIAIDASKPSKDVVGIMRGIQRAIKRASEDDLVVVTNGMMMSDDDSPEPDALTVSKRKPPTKKAAKRKSAKSIKPTSARKDARRPKLKRRNSKRA